VDPIDGLLSPTQEINVYRIVQEGLNNVVKHSRASRSGVVVRALHGECQITIQDDGCGFVPSTVTDMQDDHSGFGLLHMAERVRLLHGSMDITSSPGNGTIVRVTLATHPQTGSKAP
jgi:signal transduction histidine kinase